MRKSNSQPKQLFIDDLGKVSGGGLPTPSIDPTTQALGEEDGGNGPIFTTLALGEEDGGPNPIFTTLALGEEDGGI